MPFQISLISRPHRQRYPGIDNSLLVLQVDDSSGRLFFSMENFFDKKKTHPTFTP